jgi:peptide/nickel transport system substrate-binding protein
MKFTLFALLLAVVLSFSACGGSNLNNILERTDEPQPLPPRTNIIIGTPNIFGEFSPFFTADSDIIRLINTNLVTLDRRGEVVRNAGTGAMRSFDGTYYEYKGIADAAIKIEQDEENDEYNEISTVLTFRLRDDVFFSDGVGLTADDLIFTLYVLCDTDYNGTIDVSALPIKGLKYYRTNAVPEIYEKYREIALNYLAEMNFDEIPEAEVSDNEADFIDAGYAMFLDSYTEAWYAHVEAIVSYSAGNYSEFAHIIPGNLYTDEWVRVALAMMIWNVADFDYIVTETDETEISLLSISGESWDLRDNFPNVNDFFNEFYTLYDGNLENYINSEKIGVAVLDNIIDDVIQRFIKKAAADDEENTSVNSISGIRRINNFEVEVVLEGQIPQAIYSFVFPVAPLHYYGDINLYNYSGSRFGFTRGNLSEIRNNTREPLGAGAYRLVNYDGIVAELAANEFYFKGEPETETISFMEVAGHDLVSAVSRGFIDIAAVPATFNTLYEIEMHENIMRQDTYFGGFGYIGFNAERVNTDDDSLSAASINFRKGIATILAVYREVSITDFYGEAAGIAEYPVSGVSWVAPRRSDDGFRAAYSHSIVGSEIYNSTMTETMFMESARRAALDFFEAAGFELNSMRTAVAEFPEGMERGTMQTPAFEIFIAGGGIGNHPSYLLLTMAAETLRSMNINVRIRDVWTQGELFEAVINGEADMWCAAWNDDVLPGLSENFSSGGINNLFNLSCNTVDDEIMHALTSLDSIYYRNAMDSILDRAVIVPVYQRKVFYIFGDTLDFETIENNLTIYYNHINILERVKIND